MISESPMAFSTLTTTPTGIQTHRAAGLAAVGIVDTAGPIAGPTKPISAYPAGTSHRAERLLISIRPHQGWLMFHDWLDIHEGSQRDTKAASKPVGNVNAAAANASRKPPGPTVTLKQLTRPAQNGRDMSRYCHVTVTVTSR